MSINCLCYFCLAGNFAMMPPAIQRMFGAKNGALIYGLIYSAFGTAALATMFISKVITNSTFSMYKISGNVSYVRVVQRTLQLSLLFSQCLSLYFSLVLSPSLTHIPAYSLSLFHSSFTLFPSPHQAMIIGFGWTRVFHVLAFVSIFATFLTSMLKPLASLPSSTV